MQDQIKMEVVILTYITWTGHLLIALQIMLFFRLEILARPKELDRYTIQQKMKMILNPFKQGFDVIRSEDALILAAYRKLWLCIWALFAVRIALAAASGVLTQNPDLLAGLVEF